MNATNLVISSSDAEAYASFCWFCARVGVQPWTLEQFLLRTNPEVVQGWNDFHDYLTRPLDKRIAEVLPKKRVQPSSSDEHDAIVSGFTIGILQPNGRVKPVRPQIDSNRGERPISPLASRFCKKCSRLKAAHCFAKKRRIVREICKQCDSKAVVARRRKKKSSLAVNRLTPNTEVVQAA